MTPIEKKTKMSDCFVIIIMEFLLDKTMTCEDKPKRRRIMIISGDESVIDEIRNSRNASLCKSLILEAEDEEMDLSSSEVINRF